MIAKRAGGHQAVAIKIGQLSALGASWILRYEGAKFCKKRGARARCRARARARAVERPVVGLGCKVAPFRDSEVFWADKRAICIS